MAIIVSKVCFSWTGVQINVASPYFISVYLPYCIVWLCVILFHHGFEVVVIMQKSLVYNKSMTARFFRSQRVKTSNWSKSRQKVFCSIAKLKKWTTFNLHIFSAHNKLFKRKIKKLFGPCEIVRLTEYF